MSGVAERLLEVRYEDLVADPERELRRLLAAMDLQWHPDVVAFAQQQGYVATANQPVLSPADAGHFVGAGFDQGYRAAYPQRPFAWTPHQTRVWIPMPPSVTRETPRACDSK